MKGVFGLFAILTIVGIYVSYRYVQWLVKGDIVLTIWIMAGSTIVAIIWVVLYKMGYRGRIGC